MHRITDRQRELLQLTADGHSTKEICQRLFIAEGTAKTHFRLLFGRLNAVDRAHAVAIALREKLID